MKGRGAISNPEGRFESLRVTSEDDGWYQEALPESVATVITPERAKTLITTNDSPNVGFEYSINPYRGCEHGCIYCADGETSILLANGGSKPLGDLRVGEEIIGTEKRRHYRRYVRTTVLAHWQTRKPAHLITLANRTNVIASGEHRFLTERGWKFAARPDSEAWESLTREDSLITCDAYGALGTRAIASVQPLPGERQLFDITTGTGDFIANGVVSHNCYARPAHSYIGLSPGLDFETKLFYKADAANVLERDLSRPGYLCKPIMIGANTDPYQPIERKLEVTRRVLEVLAKCRHPVTLITKGSLIVRDIDLLADLAKDQLTQVAVSLTSLDPDIKRTLEPRTASPQARLRVIRQLSEAGIPVAVMVAPVVPAITDHEMEHLLEAAHEAGARSAGYVLLRLPYEVKTLFREWLAEHYPDRAAHVMSLVNEMRGGRDNDPNFGTRMSGLGPYAQLLRRRFQIACRRLGMNGRREPALTTSHFRPPVPAGGQFGLDF